MGNYLSMGRPPGTTPATVEEIRAAFARRPWLEQRPPDEHDSPDEIERDYLSDFGYLTWVDDHVAKPEGFSPPWLLIRLSWATGGAEYEDALSRLVDLADELGMHLCGPEGARISREDLPAVVDRHDRSGIANLFGRVRQPKKPDD